MGQFDHLHAFARRIGDAERVLRSVEGFFAGHFDEYLKLAIEVARSTLANLRPAGVEPEAWDQRIQKVSGMIGCRLVSPTTFRFRIGGGDDAIRPDQDDGSGSRTISVDWSELFADLTSLTSARPAAEIMEAIASAWQEAFRNRVGEDLLERAFGEFSRTFDTSRSIED